MVYVDTIILSKYLKVTNLATILSFLILVFTHTPMCVSTVYLYFPESCEEINVTGMLLGGIRTHDPCNSRAVYDLQDSRQIIIVHIRRSFSNFVIYILRRNQIHMDPRLISNTSP